MRWNGVVVAVFSLIAVCMLFTALVMLLGSGDKSEAHWGAIMAIISGISGFAMGAWATAHMRFDESPPTMPVDDALRMVKWMSRNVTPEEFERAMKAIERNTE